MRRFPRNGLLAIAAVAAALLVSACSSLSSSEPQGQVLVVDASGTPLQGAVVLPDPEFPPAESPKMTDSELKEHSTNAQGMILVYLDDFFWKSDACYHFRVRRGGYEDETMAVSQDLFPAVLKIDMRLRIPMTLPTPGGSRR
jgi:hypothetical protein